MQSRLVETNQSGIHQDLSALVQKHAQSTYQRPIPDFSRAAFEEFDRSFGLSGKKQIIMDSCCGTGESTAFLAASNPEAFVVGVDRSAHRLQKHHRKTGENYAILRADVEDFWRLLAEKYEHCVILHTIYYPNPCPKARHIMRRWHGHPLFSAMLRLANMTELRTNWRLYADEWAFAASLLGYTPEMEIIHVAEPITAFERKYAASGHELIRVVIHRW